MNNDDLHIENLITAYVNGTLSKDEAANFEKLIASDDSLKNRIENEKLLKQIVIQDALNDVRNKLSQFDYKKPTNKWWYLGPLLLVLTASAIWSFLPPQKSPSIEKPKLTSTEKIERHTTKNQSHPNRFKQSGYDKKIPIRKEDSPKKAAIIEPDSTQRVIRDTLTDLNPVADTLALEGTKDTPIKRSLEPSLYDCNPDAFTPNITSSESCIQEGTGTLKISAPTESRIYELTSEIAEGTLPLTIINLSADTYILTVVDNTGCLFKLIAEVEEKPCLKLDFSYSYTYDDVISFPEMGTGVIDIFDQKGTLLNTFEVQANESLDWIPTNKTGNPLDAGVYIVVAKLASGPVSGSITIMN